MNDYVALLLAHWLISGSVMVVILFAWWVMTHGFWWNDFLYNFPLRIMGIIGKIKTIKADTQQVSAKETWVNGLPRAEFALCSDYSNFMKRANSPTVFNNAKKYLVLSYQNDIKPMSMWAWVLLVGLTIAETMGTGFLLAPFIADSMSSSQIGYAGWVLAAVFACGLLWATHSAGHSLKKKKSIEHILGDLDQHGRPEGLSDETPITVDVNQDIDKDKSAQARFFRRVVKGGDRGSWVPTYFAVIGLAIVLSTVFYMRLEGIHKQNTLEVVQLEKNGVSGSNADGAVNPYAAGDGSALPPDVTQSEQQSRNKTARSLGKADFGQGLGAAFLLAMIYVITQAMGFGFAYSHSFIGEGEKAYQLTMGEPDYQSYHSKYIFPYEGRTEARLAEVRRHFCAVLPEYAKRPSTVMFHEFIHDRQASLNKEHNVDAIPPTATVISNPIDDDINYSIVAKNIMTKPKEERSAAYNEWIGQNGKKHEEPLKAAMADFKLQKKLPAIDEDLLKLFDED
jgi:hypothetical protein